MLQIKTWIQKWPRPLRFCLSGGVGTFVNLIVLIVLVEGVQMKSYGLKNLANALSMGVGAIAVFFLHRAWTWEDARRQNGSALFRQFLIFIGSLSFGIGCRLVLFAILEKYTPVPYLMNVMIGIGAAALIDYFLFDKLVFSGKDHLGQRQ